MHNSGTNQVKAINCTATALKSLNAEAVIYNFDGSVFQTKSATFDCEENNTHDCMTLFVAKEDKLENLSDIHFIKLTLKDSAGQLLSSNFYWRSKTEWKYEELQGMPKGRLTGTVGTVKDGKLTVDLENPTSGVVLMARLKVVDEKTGLLVAPVLYSDNYFSLAPHESRRIDISLKDVHPHRTVKIVVEGWNLEPMELAKSIKS
jgi:hypothetical protein